jgi:hypothetical protein
MFDWGNTPKSPVWSASELRDADICRYSRTLQAYTDLHWPPRQTASFRRIHEAFTFTFISEFVFANFTTPNSSHYADAMFIADAHPADANDISPSQTSGYCNSAGSITDWHNLLLMDRVDRLNI